MWQRMDHKEINDLVVACAGVLGLAAFVALILAPAWTAQSRVWERVAAAVLSLYVLAALAGIGVVGALVVIYLAA
jgi:hypothetical protein